MRGKHHRRVREELDAWRMARGLMHDGCTGIWLQGPRYGPRGGGDTTPQPRFLALVRDVRGGAGIAHWRGGLELLHTVGLRLRSRNLQVSLEESRAVQFERLWADNLLIRMKQASTRDTIRGGYNTEQTQKI